jgi:hypothetical protein
LKGGVVFYFGSAWGSRITELTISMGMSYIEFTSFTHGWKAERVIRIAPRENGTRGFGNNGSEYRISEEFFRFRLEPAR